MTKIKHTILKLKIHIEKGAQIVTTTDEMNHVRVEKTSDEMKNRRATYTMAYI